MCIHVQGKIAEGETLYKLLGTPHSELADADEGGVCDSKSHSIW